MFYKHNLLILAITVACTYQTEAISARWTPIDYRCPWEGFFCGSCGIIVYCERNYSAESFTAYLSTNCTLSGETCSHATGTPACTSDHDISCDPSVAAYKFKCNQPGVFPDPFTCRKYHICPTTTANSDPVTINCPGGYGFNVATLRCDIKHTYSRACSNVSRPCGSASNGIRIVGNKALYYTCSWDSSSGYYQPRLHSCPNDFIFIGGKCADPNTYIEGINKGLCTGYGKYYHPNCTMYYNCNYGQVPVETACGFGMEFDYDTKTCVDMKCRNC